MADPVPFVPRSSRNPDEPEDLREVVANLINAVAEMDGGMKALVDIIAKHDVQVRKLELELRKATRKKVPVIVNQHGERAN